MGMVDMVRFDGLGRAVFVEYGSGFGVEHEKLFVVVGGEQEGLF